MQKFLRTNKISTKYTLLIVTVITIITLIFIPAYLFVQKSMYISLEMKSIVSFYDTLIDAINLSDKDAIEEYLREHNEKNYRIQIYDSQYRQIYTYSDFQKRKSTDSSEQELKYIPDEHRAEYTMNSKPSYFEDNNTDGGRVVLRRKTEVNGTSYYIVINERLRNIESILNYTNKFLVIILILYIAVCAISLYFAMRGMTRSIYRLTDVIKKISKEDYSVRYEWQLPNDEIGILASHFNNMLDTIQANMNSIENYNFLLKSDIKHLKEYEDMRRRLVRNVTHELKTPLAIISSQVEMMAYIKDEKKRQHYYESAMEEIQKMSSMITNFLHYSTEESRTLQSAVEELNLSETVRQLCMKISKVVRAKKVQFQYDIEDNIVIQISKMHVEHIFNNYMMNAVTHTRPEHKITVTLTKKASGCRLSVYNDGEVIPEIYLDDIWTEFYSSHEQSKDNAGLGLFIVKEIALLNHMVCGVTNHDEGVEFWFDFK